MISNSEPATIAIEALKIAQRLATLPDTKDDIGRAIEWAEEMAEIESQLNEQDNQNEHDISVSIFS
jgi:uncharacterized protein Smg (DUF494 family)